MDWQDQIPEMSRVSSLFKWKLLLTSRDRFSSNPAAERLLASEGGWKQAAFPCDVHKANTVSSLTWGLVEDDVSGLISSNMAQAGAGVLTSLREILSAIFREQLQVCYEAPPGGSVARYRQEVLDTFLPVDSRSQKLPRSLQRQKRRFILGSTLNGDLQQSRIVHFCPYGCCSSHEETLWKFDKLVTYALLPHKLERFCRSRWAQQLDSVCWAGILFSFHNIGEQLLLKFVGPPRQSLAQSLAALAPCAMSAAMSSEADLDALLADGESSNTVPLQQNHPAAENPEAEAPAEGEFDFDEADEDLAATLSDLLKEPDYVRQKKAFKAKCRRWAQSNPLPRLVALAHCLRALDDVIFKFLDIASLEWEKRQILAAAQGRTREFRVLAAHKNQAATVFGKRVSRLLSSILPAFPASARRMSYRSLAFRCVSRAAGAFHQQLVKPRSMYPYKLFRIVDDDFSEVLRDPACMHDALATEFFEQFSNLEHDPMERAQASVVAESLARLIEVDISGLEARHALSRKLAVHASVHTWLAGLPRVSADFVCRQAARQMQSNASFRPAAAQKPSTAETQLTAASKKKKGSGGGPLRAFLHEHHRGRMFTRESLQQAHAAFKQLTPPERAHYEHVGQCAAIARKHGFPAFGPKAERRLNSAAGAQQPLPIGSQTETGAIVAAADSGCLQDNAALLPYACHDFEVELKKISSRHARHTAESRQAELSACADIQRYCAEVQKTDEVLLESAMAMVGVEFGASDKLAAAQGTEVQ